MRHCYRQLKGWLARWIGIDPRDDRGGIFSEYGLLIGTIGVAGAAGAALLAGRVTDWFNALP